MMGKGYWLDPKTQQSWVVDRHERFVLENPLICGVPPEIHAHLLTLDTNKAMDEIRLAAIHAGLIRVRDHLRYVSVQFCADSNEMTFLRSVFVFLDEIVLYKDTPLVIGNFATRVETTITLRELGRKVNS